MHHLLDGLDLVPEPGPPLQQKTHEETYWSEFGWPREFCVHTTRLGYSAVRVARRLPPTGSLYSVESDLQSQTVARQARSAAQSGARGFVVGRFLRGPCGRQFGSPFLGDFSALSETPLSSLSSFLLLLFYNSLLIPC